METSKKQIREYKKIYPYLSIYEIETICEKYQTPRGVVSNLRKLNNQHRDAYTGPLPVYIEIKLTWRRSIYGMCPRAEMRWTDTAGKYHYLENAGYAGGCGYDKTSEAVAQCLNRFESLRYSIRNKNYSPDNAKKPYGIRKAKGTVMPYFEGGVGISCYPRICAWIGYEFTHVAEGKTYDKFVITRKQGRKAASN